MGFTALRRPATRHRVQATVRRHQTIRQRRLTTFHLQQTLQVHLQLKSIQIRIEN